MPRALIRRILVGALLTAAILVAGLGIYEGAYMIWARRTVEYALSGRAGSNTAKDKLKKMGERAVPLIFGEMRDHMGDPDTLSAQFFEGETLLCSMAQDQKQKLDPRIPCLGRVLKNTGEDQHIRKVAMDVIGMLWYSAPATDALAERAVHDPSIEFRADCLVTLARQVAGRAFYTNSGDINPTVVRLLRNASKDHDPRIRSAACYAAGTIVGAAIVRGKNLEWASTLLAGYADDPDPQVRWRYAAEMESVRRIRKKRSP